jgi:hypothetical protein
VVNLAKRLRVYHRPIAPTLTSSSTARTTSSGWAVRGLARRFSGLASSEQAAGWAQRALRSKNTLRDVDAAIVEAAFASRMAELGEDGESPWPLPPKAGETPVEASVPPTRAELMAALRASAGLDTTNEAPPPTERCKRKQRSRAQAPLQCLETSPPPQPSASPQPEPPPVNNAVVWHVVRERPVFTVVIRQ